jgi:hypothetical protein
VPRYKQQGDSLVPYTAAEEAQADLDIADEQARDAAMAQAKANRLVELEDLSPSENAVPVIVAKLNKLAEAVRRLENLE